MAHHWSWQLLRAGSFRLDGGSLFGVVPRTIWASLQEPDENNRIPLQTNCLLLDDGSRKVLIETGFGDKWSDKERGFYELQHRASMVRLLARMSSRRSLLTTPSTSASFRSASSSTSRNSRPTSVLSPGTSAWNPRVRHNILSGKPTPLIPQPRKTRSTTRAPMNPT